MKKAALLVIGILCLSAQDSVYSKSFYLGWGIGTNIGGAIGVGFENEIIKDFTYNIALGSLHPVLKESVTFSKFDFDLGVKYYLFGSFYTGLNYGIVDYQYSESGVGDVITEKSGRKIRGLALTLGYKHQFISQWYLSGFIGKVLVQDERKPTGFKFIDDSSRIPRFGLLIGYEF